MITYNKPSVWKMQIEIRTKDRILSRADSTICHNEPEREEERFRHEEDGYDAEKRTAQAAHGTDKKTSGRQNRI
jgi:hypothetical protein